MTRLPHLASLALMFVVLATTAPNCCGQLKAFETAEGFGRFAQGARTNLSAASVYHVTNLNNSGAGSFRDAVSQSNRFIVFDVSGVINIDSAISVQSNITIAGQTSPGGITVYGDKVSFTNAHNLISRHFAVRKGNAGDREDTAGLARGTNMIFDHMSFTWGVDETFSMNPDSGYTIDNITIQNSIIAQGLDRLGHSAGGLMTLNEGNRFSVIKSIFADNVTRNPKVRGENEFINNVVYGWESAGYIMGDTVNMTSHANVEGNYFIEGPVDGGGPFNSGTNEFKIYANDNWVDTNRDGVLNGVEITSYPGADVVGTRHAFPTFASMTAHEALDYVLAHAGPSIIRDAVDQRIVDEINSFGTLGGVIQRETDLFPNFGSDPQYVISRARFTDADNDGIADNWEAANGLSGSDANDWKNLNAQGYTMLEQYINELGSDGELIISSGGAWSDNATWNGAAPTLADEAIVVGGLSITGENAFARRLALAGDLTITAGFIDVVDTATFSNGNVAISGGTATFGELRVGSAGETAGLSLSDGGTLQIATVTDDGGNASFDWNGGTVRATNRFQMTLDTNLGSVGGILDTNGNDGEFSGQISGTGKLTKTGSGTLVLSGDNSYGGGTDVTGRLKLTHSNAAGTGDITVNAAGGIIELGDGVTINNNLRTDYIYEILDVADANATATMAGDITMIGNRQIRVQTTGSNARLNLTGNVDAGNSFFILRQGNVDLREHGTLNANHALIGRDGGIANFSIRDNAVANINNLNMGGGKALSAGSITVGENGTLNTGNNSIDLLNTTSSTSISRLNLAGGTTITGGFVKTSTGADQTSEINFNGGTLKYGGSTTNDNFLAALPGVTANVQSGGAVIDDSGQAITISQDLVHDANLTTPDGGLTKLGSGTLTLTGNNSYDGSTTIRGGVLSTSSINDGGSTSGIGSSAAGAENLVLDGGTLRYTGAATQVDRTFTVTENGGTIDASGTGTLQFRDGGGAIQLTGSGARTLTLTGNNSGWNTLDRELVDSAATQTKLVKDGSGTWRLLNTSSSWTGGTEVNDGTLLLWWSDLIPTGAGMGNVAVNGNGVIDTNGAHHTFNGLDGDGTILHRLNNRTLTIGNGDADGNFNGTITITGGSLAINKIGTGTQVLGGTGDYSGTTTVSAGTLLINGDFGQSDSIVMNAATLGGHGTIQSITADAGSTINPGNSIDTLTVLEHAVLDGTLEIELDGTDDGLTDLLSVGGLLDIDGATLSLINIGELLDDDVYLFATYGSLNGTFENVVGLPNNYMIDYAYDTGNGFSGIALVAVPEPSMLLPGLALLGGILTKRRRQLSA